MRIVVCEKPANRPVRRLTFCLMGWLAVLLLAGCGGGCPREVADYQSLLEVAPADNEVDGFVEVPFSLVDGWLAEALGRVEPVALPVPGLGKWQIAPKGIRLQPGPPGQLAMTVEFAVVGGGKVLFTLTNEAHVAVKMQAEEHRVSFTIGPESLRKISPRLGPEAASAVERMVRAELPAVLRTTLPPARLRALTDRALEAVVDGAYALLRDGRAAALLPRTEVHLDLPEVPLRRIDLRSRVGWLSVGLHADLGPTDGAMSLPAAPAAPPDQRVRVRLSGHLVAGLANRAIAAGEVPGRYSSAGKPTPEGPLQVGVGWVAGPRPFKVLAWQTQGTCMHARFGGTPRLSRVGRDVELRVADGTVEAVEGSWWVQVGAWLTGVWERSLRFTQTAVAETRFDVGGRQRVMALEEAQVGPQGIDFILKISP